ncbi:MAG: DUF6805 domain-containing protein [Gemmatimonadota bacterium]
MPSRSVALILALTTGLLTTAMTRPGTPEGDRDRRVVDLVLAGDVGSEATHGYAGHDARSGLAAGKPFRQTAGWMHYAMTTFDDTPVTLALTFVGVESQRRRYYIVVEDSVIASREFSAPADSSVVVEISVPFSITKGRSNIAVVIRARSGVTPALREMRTVQDHHEAPHSAIR